MSTVPAIKTTEETTLPTTTTRLTTQAATATTLQPDDLVCANQIDNCEDYGLDLCTGAYQSWMTDKCSLFCGFCATTAPGLCFSLLHITAPSSKKRYKNRSTHFFAFKYNLWKKSNILQFKIVFICKLKFGTA